MHCNEGNVTLECFWFSLGKKKNYNTRTLAKVHVTAAEITFVFKRVKFEFVSKKIKFAKTAHVYGPGPLTKENKGIY